MPNILAFDTSTDSCSVALSIGGLTTERFEIAPRRHAELLLPMVDDLLSCAKASLQSLDALAFGCGPGSFMGVRLATSVAQGLGFSAKRSVIPISSLQALAQRGRDELEHSFIIAGWDARMHEIYWGAYIENESGIMLPLDADHISRPEEINVLRGKPWTLVGNAWGVYQAHLPANLALESHLLYPRAVSMIALANHYLSNKVSPMKAQPNYLREQVTFKPA